MQYQLVLRFRREALKSAADIDAVEHALAEALAGSARVDGHDASPRFIDVFVLTADPGSTFRRSKPALESLQLLERVVAAYRLEGGARFTVLWPLKYGRKFSLD